MSVLQSETAACSLETPRVHQSSFTRLFLSRCMSIPITMRAIRRKVTPAADPESSAAMESTDQSVPEIISTVSREAAEDDRMSSPPGYFLMSVAGPAADNVNTDALANRSPCASLGVYSHWATSGLPEELL